MSGERSIWKFVQTYANFSSGYRGYGIPALVAPANIILSENYSALPVNGKTRYGHYLSASALSNSEYAYLDLQPQMFYPGYPSSRRTGMSLRCLAR